MDIDLFFKVGDAVAAPDGDVSVPFSIATDRESQGFSYSVRFDPQVLQAMGTTKLWEKPGGTPYELKRFEHDNVSGFVVGAAVISFSDTGDVLLPDREVEVLAYRFHVDGDAPVGASTELRFEDGGRGSGGPVDNRLIAGGTTVSPRVANSFVFVNGVIDIIGDITMFVRGDPNRDGKVDISDAQSILGFLFLGERRPMCLDAADVNDSGKVDVSDPSFLLNFLFLGGEVIPAPYPLPGADPTTDAVSCGQSTPS